MARFGRKGTPKLWINAIKGSRDKVDFLSLEFRTGRAEYEQVDGSELEIPLVDDERVVDAQDLGDTMWEKAKEHASTENAAKVDFHLVAWCYDEKTGEEKRLWEHPGQVKRGSDGITTQTESAGFIREAAMFLKETRALVKDLCAANGDMARGNAETLRSAAGLFENAKVATQAAQATAMADADRQTAQTRLENERMASEHTRAEAWATTRQTIAGLLTVFAATQAAERAAKEGKPPPEAPRIGMDTTARPPSADAAIASLRRIKLDDLQVAKIKQIDEQLAGSVVDVLQVANDGSVSATEIRDALQELLPMLLAHKDKLGKILTPAQAVELQYLAMLLAVPGA